MKIEQLIVQHLYQQKKVTLQGIGTFTLNPSVALPAEGDKDFVMPEHAIQFEYNLKTTEDESLIDFVVKQTSKIKPLASADLDSYITLAKQFLNIGKPLLIEGVGTIQKNQQGDYVFIEGQFITPRIDDIPKQVREKRDETVSFESESRTDNSKRNLLIALFIVAIGLAGLGIYYWLSGSKTPPQATVAAPPAEPVAVIDTTKKDSSLQVKPDSTAIKPVAPVLSTSDSSSFKIVLKDYSTEEAAKKAFDRLSSYGHKLVMQNKDSSTFIVAMPFTRSLADTAKAKDSVRILFGGRPYVQLSH